ncbi:T9SS type A sorting domain-containing protein [Flavobacterium zepuense]|uniref:T9SS type A sorting domain-containing protein n=1 Tax=Flavobacterium zepuense TaxID=2593302 RepID=A0A552UZ62_9FLAO|nr:GDSL-type esterase/lipase family protein [Flavobacterium zepuense]TRW23516.1 T9SS type A sorting domain-containing protein [Flavobacterium zepuense]
MNAKKILTSLLLLACFFTSYATFANSSPNNPFLTTCYSVEQLQLKGIAGRGEVLLQWEGAADNVSYTVQRSIMPGGSYVVVQQSLTGNFCFDDGLINDTLYYYTVTARASDGVTISTATVALQPSDTIKVACMGDSITYGYSLSNPGVYSYPARLQDLLPDGYTATNYGSSGKTLLFNSGASYITNANYSNAVNSEPNIIVIMLGTNDSRQITWDALGSNFIDNYKTMINQLQNLPSNPRIFIALPPKAFSSAFDINETRLASDIRPDIVTVANETGVSVIDVFDASKDTPSAFPDGVHPGESGGLLIAQKVADLILMPQVNITNNQNTLTAPAAIGYQWYKEGVKIEGATGQTHEAEASGNYSVLIKLNEDNEDRVMSNPLAVNVLSSPEFVADTNDFLIYPSPARSVITVESTWAENLGEVQIFNTLGAMVYSENNINKPKATIPVTNLAPGIYTVKVHNTVTKRVSIAN